MDSFYKIVFTVVVVTIFIFTGFIVALYFLTDNITEDFVLENYVYKEPAMGDRSARESMQPIKSFKFNLPKQGNRTARMLFFGDLMLDRHVGEKINVPVFSLDEIRRWMGKAKGRGALCHL